MDRIRAHFIDTHVSFIYESIAREALWQRNTNRERVDCWPWDFAIDKIGRWWNREQEIDIVALDTSGADIVFGECKYWNSKVGSAVFHALVEKARAVDWKKSARRDHYVLFAIHGFTDELLALARERHDLLLIETW
jgi:AAA+ ATPase superfamily predicted ATPase